MIEKLARRLPFFYGWIVVDVVFVTMTICVNARTAVSLLFPAILGEFGWERGVTAAAFSFGFIVSAAPSPLLGRLMDRHGPRVVTEIGIAATAAGLLLGTFATQPWHVYVTLGMLVGAGTTFTGYTGQALFLPNWFVRRRGLAISIAFRRGVRLDRDAARPADVRGAKRLACRVRAAGRGDACGPCAAEPAAAAVPRGDRPRTGRRRKCGA